MPALPINPYQVPQQQQQNVNWQVQQQQQINWALIQQQQQQVIQQQSQPFNSWAPAMATNVTNVSSNQNAFLNNSSHQNP